MWDQQWIAILFSDPSGPLLTYRQGVLHIADLNPELKTQWRMTRWEMAKLGLRCLTAAIFSEQASTDIKQA